MRRANGTGTIRKSKEKRRKPWAAIRSSANGKRVLIGYFETKAAAEQALALDTIIPASELKNLTVKEVFEAWKKTRAYTRLSRQTRDNYNAAFAHMKRFHTVKFRDMRQEHWQRCIDTSTARSFSSQNKIKILAKRLSDYAVNSDIVFKSYASGLITDREKKSDITVFSETEIKKLFDNDKAPFVDSILILIYTGLRIREFLSLKKFQVDIKNMVIRGGSKTAAGHDRVIPIHKKIQKYVLNISESSTEYFYVHKHNGEVIPWSYWGYLKNYKQTLESLGIEYKSPHKTRHTFVSMLDERGGDDTALAKVTGHADPNFSKKRYSHPDIERLRRAVDKI